MLTQLTIQQYAIVDNLEVELGPGMTVITGETGAGKSIMLDALGLCIGDRADTRTIRPGATRTDITAVFDLADAPAARSWLEAQDFDGDECIIRRTVGIDGRSRAFINGAPATLGNCAALGALLVDIHSQHAHQSLLRRGVQRELLDDYAGARALAAQVAEHAANWHALKAKLDHLSAQSADNLARLDLLTYQVEELDNLALGDNELEELEQEQKQLAHASFIIESAMSAAEQCEAQADQLRALRRMMDDERHIEGAITNIREMLASADIQLDEARAELRNYAERVEVDPVRLEAVDRRLEQIYDFARKHRVQPGDLAAHHTALREELDALGGGDAQLDALTAEVAEAHVAWKKSAAALTKSRRNAAEDLAVKTMACLGRLAMERAGFQVALTPRKDTTPHPHGAEEIEFLIATNPGSPPGSLSRVASGGELSRISLALQVVAANSAASPTMIFDEVDVGIGGAVADVVGGLLRQLGERVQVLCVTHLPQVAAKGTTHLQVNKSGDERLVVTTMQRLEAEARVEEIARMLGGVTITDNTRNHAREMLG